MKILPDIVKSKSLIISTLILVAWILLALLSLFFNPSAIRLESKLLPPFTGIEEGVYLLGSDQLGRDVLSMMIEGSANAFLIGFFSMLIASIIGITVGSLSAYFQDNKLNINILRLIIYIITFSFYLTFIVACIPWFNMEYYSFLNHFLIPTILLAIVFFITYRFLPSFTRVITFPLDLFLGRIIEIFESLPTLFILVGLSTLVSGTWYSIAIIIGLTSWPAIAKFSRSEFIKVKQLEYIEATDALGLKKSNIILNHLIPNAISPVLITLAFGIANAVIIESTLSFLGLGLNAETTSWGSILASARLNQEAWWLTLIPSIAIFLVVYSCTTIGEKLNN